MSSIGSDPDEYTPGNQPDGFYYNLYPDSSQPGLFGGQYADLQASAPANGGMNWANGSSVDVSGDGTGLPFSVTVAPNFPRLPDATTPASFNLYDWLHGYLNRPGPSKTLQFAQDLARSFEHNGDRAAAVGGAGALLGAATLDPPVAAGSGVLFGLGESMNKVGKGLDAGTSFLKSVQQDNGQPSTNFIPRAGEPGFSDLAIPDS